MQPQLKKEKSKKITIQAKGILQLVQAQDRQKIKQQIIQKIKPLSFKNKDQLQSAFKKAVSLKYNGDGQNKQEQIPKQKISQVLHDIQKLNIGLKQCQVSSPIIDVFNHTYYQLLSQCLKNTTIQKKQLIQLWQIVPARDLQHFLQKLCLLQQYKNLNKQKFLKTLISLLADNKIQQVCCYYKLNPTYPQFEQQILLPKILITDQIYTPAIIQLLQIHTELKYKVINYIDLSKAVIILQHLAEDPRLYDNVNKFILRKHYKSMCHEYSQWYIFQDKMSFNKQFIQWYCQQQQLHQQIKQSIKYRNAIQNKYNKQIIVNPLYQFDSFIYSEFIFRKFQHQNYANITVKDNKNVNNNKNDIIKPLQQQYALLSQYNITQQNIHFVHDSNTKQFAYMTQILLQHQYLGFDAQYRCTSTKYQQLGVALIQISTRNQIFLIDFINLQNDYKFIQFFKRFLSDPKIFIVGHSVQSDIKFIQRTMKIQEIQGIIDIAKIFKQKFPNQTQNSLAFMTYFMTGKQLSKYQQRSNWNRRPLKKSQIHYAALDAKICLILYQMLKDQQIKHTQAIVKNKKVTIEKLIRKQNIVYKPQHQQMLSDARPKFLIDSMLKRLCSLLRNLGIDAQYMAVSNYQLIQQIAKKQNRIILTRDRKLLNKKSPVMPIYCICQKGDSDLMLQQIKKQFNLDYSLFVPLSRCVKCNCSQIQLISTEQALKYVNFQYEDSKIKQFWRCMKCRQVYWEGNQWKNAKKKFQGLG